METGPVEVFFSYSHEDEALKDELVKHLSLLRRENVISAWHDRKIGAGHEWAKEISSHLESASIVLLLVSSDFLASDYCWDTEMKRAMERHDHGEARVIPVVLRPVDWSRAPFARLNALPREGKPVTSWTNSDEAFVQIAQGIRHEVESFLSGELHPVVEAKLKSAESSRNWPNVVQIGERILKKAPNSAVARKAVGRALVARWRFNLYVGVFSSVEVRLTRSDEAKRKMDEATLRKRVMADVSRAIELEPGNADYYYIRGSIDRDRDVEERIADLNRALELKPNDAKTYYQRARYLDYDNEAAADRDYKKVIELGFEQKPFEFNVDVGLDFLQKYLPDLAAKVPAKPVPPKPHPWGPEFDKPRHKIDGLKLQKHTKEDLEKIWS